MDKNGNVTMHKMSGVFQEGNKAHEALMNEIKSNKDFSHVKVENGQGFDLTSGADGKVATGTLVKGGVSQNLNQNIVRKGSDIQDGYFAKTGFSLQNLNERSNSGAFTIADPDTGKPITVQGKWFSDEKGNVISAQYTNIKNGEVFTAQKVTTGGKETWQYGVSKSQVGPDGKRVFSFKSVSDREVATGEFVAKEKIGPDGKTIYQNAEGGQNVNWYHQYMQHEKIGSEQSVLRYVVGFGTDLTNLQPWQMTAIRTGGQIHTGIEGSFKMTGLKGGLFPDKANNAGNLSGRNWKHLEPKKPSIREIVEDIVNKQQ